MSRKFESYKAGEKEIDDMSGPELLPLVVSLARMASRELLSDFIVEVMREAAAKAERKELIATVKQVVGRSSVERRRQFVMDMIDFLSEDIEEPGSGDAFALDLEAE